MADVWSILSRVPAVPPEEVCMIITIEELIALHNFEAVDSTLWQWQQRASYRYECAPSQKHRIEIRAP